MVEQEHTTEQEQRPRRVAVIMAHPDDAEFICAGAAARWAAEGQEIVYVLGTSGDKGSDDPEMSGERLIAIREAEQHAACDILGVSEVVFLRMRDAELVPDLNMRRELTRVIRRLKPDAVVCQDPTARWEGGFYLQHPDHVAMGEATLAAVYPSARDRLTFPELIGEGLEPHKVRELYISTSPEKCNHVVDISGYLDKKFDALAAHASQMGEWDFRPMLTQWAADTAAEARRRGIAGADSWQHAEMFAYLKLD